MMLETILTILQSLVLPALVPLVHRALQVYLWRRRAEDVREYNVMLAAAQTDEVRRVIEANPPPAPPDFGAIKTLLILLLSGAALVGALGKVPLLVAAHQAQLPVDPVSSCGRAPLPAQSPSDEGQGLEPSPTLAKSGPFERSCSRNSDCGSGCSCEKGSCACTARRPSSAPAPRQSPRHVAALGTGTLCADCLALPWHVQPVDVLYSRRRED